MNHLKYVMFISLIVSSIIEVKAQDFDSIKVAFKGLTTHADKVRLRWSPLAYEYYLRGVEYGWTLERATYADNGVPLGDSAFDNSQVVLKENFSVKTEAQWANTTAPQELLDAVVEILYNQDPLVSDFDSINVFSAYQHRNNANGVIAILNICADRNFNVAQGLGWAYQDATIEGNREYIYKLTLFDANSQYDEFYALVSTAELYSKPSLPQPFAEAGDSIVMVICDVSSLKNDYFAYEMQRYDGQEWINTSDVPYYTETPENESVFRAIDSLPDNDSEYLYRIRGLTPFGIKSGWSPSVAVTGVPSPVPAIPYIEQLNDTLDEIQIIFSFPQEYEQRIQGFEVIKSESRQGPFETLNESLLAPSVRSFFDTEPGQMNYYFVRAIDVNGYALLSMPAMYQAPDTVAPLAPTGLTGSIDDNGMANISWSANSEKDVKGYKVFASNNSQTHFLEVSPGTVNDTVYQYQLDLEVLADKWYVRVKAIDYHENDGEFSAIVELDRPDIIPPPKPLLENAEVMAGGVGLNWTLTSSPDATLQILQRKQGSADWEDIFDATTYNGYMEGQQFAFDSVGPMEPVKYDYVDTTVITGKAYSYRLIAMDSHENISSSVILKIVAYDDGVRGTIVNLGGSHRTLIDAYVNAYVTQETHDLILVEWDYTQSSTVQSFVIYRSVDDYPFRAYASYLADEVRKNPAINGLSDQELNLYQSVASQPFAFLDNDIKSGQRYRYKVLAKHLDGGFSELSSDVTILIP